jgi:hypothetical protein
MTLKLLRSPGSSRHLIEKILERPKACLVAIYGTLAGRDPAADLGAERPVARQADGQREIVVT